MTTPRRRKVRVEGLEAPDALATPPAAGEQDPEPVAAAPQPYRVGSWRGHPNYACSRCSFATLDKSAILRHVIGRHGGLGVYEDPDATTHS